MHRSVRVAEYWNWLPAFRAVAETSNLRDAARRIHVAPSAISRTVRLLESSLGHPLFERTSSTLVLNAAGRRLLEAVRGAMRLVDGAQGDNEREGPSHIHCPTDLVPLLLDALESWVAEHPGGPPLVHVPPAEDVSAQLLRGDLDAAIAVEPAIHAGVTSTVLGELSSSVYCAPAHPASRLARLTEKDLARLPFVDYPAGELAFLRIMRDQVAQRVAYVPTMDLAARLSARGVGLVCVPDFVAKAAGVSLTRLPLDLPLARLYVWYRCPLSGVAPPAIVEHLTAQAVFSALVSRKAPPPRERAASPEPAKRNGPSRGPRRRA
jgi:DNA-binding transcriptional LysR family regulator